MLTEQTVERLRHLPLGAIAEAYLAQQRDPSTASLSFDERLGMLLDAEQLARDNRALTRRLKEAKLRVPRVPRRSRLQRAETGSRRDPAERLRSTKH